MHYTKAAVLRAIATELERAARGGKPRDIHMVAADLNCTLKVAAEAIAARDHWTQMDAITPGILAEEAANYRQRAADRMTMGKRAEQNA